LAEKRKGEKGARPASTPLLEIPRPDKQKQNKRGEKGGKKKRDPNVKCLALSKKTKCREIQHEGEKRGERRREGFLEVPS